MPVFYLLCRFFTTLSWERRGLRALATHRFRHIAIPLALGALTTVPITQVAGNERAWVRRAVPKYLTAIGFRSSLYLE